MIAVALAMAVPVWVRGGPARGQGQAAGQVPAQSQAQGQGQGQAQTQAAAMNRNVVVLDPAHGGPDPGAKLGERLLEKDVTMALATRLRTLLTAAGFTVVSTHEGDMLNVLTTDQRAETANRARALACVVIHATGTGTGVHLYRSTLAAKQPPQVEYDLYGAAHTVFEPTPWETAQAEWVTLSGQLQDEAGGGLRAAGIPLVMGRAAVRPLDNLTCPALAVEIAPLGQGGDLTAVNDADYQQRVAATLSIALQSWRAHVQAAATAVGSGGGAAGAGAGSAGPAGAGGRP